MRWGSVVREIVECTSYYWPSGYASTEMAPRTFTRKGSCMKRLLTAALTVGILGCQTTGEKKVKLDTQKDKVSYSIGLNVGKNLQRDSISVNPDALLRGILDASADSSSRLMSDRQAQETLMEYQQELRTKQIAGAKKKGDDFMAQNAKEPGVVTLPSGLQYKILTEGKGKSPKLNSTVTTHYSGKLLDGTEFDSSYKRGEPATFKVSGVIKGWTEALQLMKEGSKWELYIPSDLAYGERGASGVIPPNATLIFQVELLAVK